jgi:hypothetical protein
METKAKGEHKQAIALTKRMITARCTVILAAGPSDNENRATVRERFEIGCNKRLIKIFAGEKSMLEGSSLRLRSETAEVDKELGDVAAKATNTEIKIQDLIRALTAEKKRKADIESDGGFALPLHLGENTVTRAIKESFHRANDVVKRSMCVFGLLYFWLFKSLLLVFYIC